MSRVSVTVPKIGLTAESVTVERWIKGVGDRVEGGETIAELQTDKAVLDLEAPTTGVLVEIHVVAGAEASIGAVLATIDSET